MIWYDDIRNVELKTVEDMADFIYRNNIPIELFEKENIYGSLKQSYIDRLMKQFECKNYED